MENDDDKDNDNDLLFRQKAFSFIFSQDPCQVFSQT